MHPAPRGAGAERIRVIRDMGARLAVIDLGTNSVRMDVYHVASENSTPPVLLHRERRMIRLGEGVFRTGELQPGGVERALGAFSGLQQILRELAADRVTAFATCALRESRDAGRLIRAIRERTCIELEVISGEEEAALIAQGILSRAEELPGDRFALVDVGGGSTEITFCEERRALAGFSLPLGSSRFEQLFFQKLPSGAGRAEAARVAARELRAHVLACVRERIDADQCLPVVSLLCSGGTIRACSELVARAGLPTQPFSRSALERILERILPLDAAGLQAIPGMDLERLDIIVPGGLLLHGVLEALGASQVSTTPYALREGILDRELSRLRA